MIETSEGEGKGRMSKPARFVSLRGRQIALAEAAAINMRERAGAASTAEEKAECLKAEKHFLAIARDWKRLRGQVAKGKTQ